MNSPFNLTSLIIALILACIGYVSTFVIDPSGALIAVIAFISALVGASFSASNEDAENDDETSHNLKTLYVGNLPYRANEAAVRRLFSDYGFVSSVRLMKDKQTGKRRGFGFVEMASAAADKAIDSLNDTEFQQRTLKVREAKEKPEPRNDSE